MWSHSAIKAARRGSGKPWLAIHRILAVVAMLLLVLAPVSHAGANHEMHGTLSDSVMGSSDHHSEPSGEEAEGCCHAIAACAGFVTPSSSIPIQSVTTFAADFDQSVPLHEGRESRPDLQPPTA